VALFASYSHYLETFYEFSRTKLRTDSYIAFALLYISTIRYSPLLHFSPTTMNFIKNHPPKPTDAELAVLHVLWQHGTATVRFINDALNQHNQRSDAGEISEIGYTTTLKIMQIMHEKGLLARDESARTHIYRPAVAKEEVQTSLVERFVENVFRGSALTLALQALGSSNASDTSKEELQQLRALLDEKIDEKIDEKVAEKKNA
jgi:BlaI family transcriptional regulator, penicillinase repressor